MTASDMRPALMAMFPEVEGWLYINEFRVATGFGPGNDQRLDAFVINAWPSVSRRIAIEVKVSLSDLRREIKNPTKRLAGYRMSNEFYIATPAGMIKDQLPSDCGLIEVEGGIARVVEKAPWHDGEPPTWLMFASLARRTARSEVPPT